MNSYNGYIDIHSHILPGVDDGSRSMDETVKMLRVAHEQQIGVIIATPHYIPGGDNTPVDKLREIRAQVQAEAYKIDENLRILLGNELYYSESVPEALRSGEALTIAGSRYILVEFSTKETYNTMFRGLSELVRAGYYPILAHVERYHSLYKDEYRISELIKLGCYIQMNSHSLTGNFLNSEAVLNRKLFSHGLIHFVGTDCHNSEVRVPDMSAALKDLHKKCDESLINRIFYENPMKVIENTYI